MRTLIHSDLFRSLGGGFMMGIIALVAMTPAEGTETLKSKIESIYRA